MTEAIATKNLEAEIISAGMAADAMKQFLDASWDEIREVAEFIVAKNPKRLVISASGASWSSLYTGHYIMDCFSSVPSVHYFGPEMEERDPVWLGDDCVGILASYSGKTTDTVHACEYLKEKGIATVSLCRDKDGPLGAMTDRTIAYDSKCLYTSPAAGVALLMSFVLQLRNESEAEALRIQDDLRSLPERLQASLADSEELGKQIAETIIQEPIVYFVAGGPLHALGYQVAYTWVMEYLHRDAAYIHQGEFRHGPLEVLQPGHPCTIHLLGNDSGRAYAEVTRNYCSNEGAKAFSIDSEDFCKGLHPALNPLAVFATLNYMLLHGANALGVDLDEYLQMHVKPYFPGETYF